MQENKENYIWKWMLLIFFSLFALAILVWAFKTNALAGISVYEYSIEQDDKLTTLLSSLKIEAPKETPKKVVKPRITPKKQIVPTPKEKLSDLSTKDDKFDIDKLAKAIALAETWNCTKGYGKTYNNCFWIKNWNTAPCKKVGRNRMCIYEKPEDSYVAFKTIWMKWYKTMPTHKQAVIWSWNDDAVTWRQNVLHHYTK